VTLDGQQVALGGDVITALNGQTITDIQGLKTALAQLPSDHVLTLTILRDNTQLEITLQTAK